MSEDREKVLRMALIAVVATAVEQGCDVELLCEGAIQSMLDDRECDADTAAEAAIAIEVAADALHHQVE